MVPLILVNSGADYVGLQLSYFQCHSDGEQVLKIAHLKDFQIGRKSWVVKKKGRVRPLRIIPAEWLSIRF